MRQKLVIFLVFISLCRVSSLLVKLQEYCVPTRVVKGPCHECLCDAEGVFVCHEMPCQTTEAIKQVDHEDLPEIEDGQSCIPGKVYKMLCNTCQCRDNNSLLCTKMACFENAMLRHKANKNTLRKGDQGDKNNEVAKIKEMLLKKGTNENSTNQEVRIIKKDKLSEIKSAKGSKKIDSNHTQLLKGECQPGMTYRNGCKKCFCNEKKVAKCTKTCSKAFLSHFSDKEMSELETRNLLDLPELPHMGAKCDPGRTYYVVCNICFCTQKQDLYCSMKYCVNIPTYTDTLSKELTGRACKKDFKLLCSECKCVNSTSQCTPVPNCGNNITGKQLLSTASSVHLKLTLDVKKDKCTPNVSYKLHCNDCYCQPDGSLRCTQKICLTYSQTRDLQEKQIYLEKHGL